MNQASAFIDGSPIYSSSLQDNNNRLRDHDGGYLRTPTEKDGRYMLPRSKEANDGCNRKDMLDQERFCFKSGTNLEHNLRVLIIAALKITLQNR